MADHVELELLTALEIYARRPEFPLQRFELVRGESVVYV
jgi:hypothetical protein